MHHTYTYVYSQPVTVIRQNCSNWNIYLAAGMVVAVVRSGWMIMDR